MIRRKAVLIVSDIDKALAFEWLALRLKERVDLSFILISKSDSQLAKFLRTHAIEYYEVNGSQSRFRQWLEVVKILYRLKPKVVHAHLWRANLVGLSAAWLLRVPLRIFTRHHATVHYREFPRGRKWDILCNMMATNIIAVSKNIEEILIKWDKANPKKIKVIHHGFDFDYFKMVDEERVISLREKYGLVKQQRPIVGVIARYLEWKGIQYILPAFERLRSHYPSAHLILANAHGEYAPLLKQKLADLPKESYTEISFETDLAALYRLFDVYVHVPIDPYVEAFGQTYVEALLCRVPCVFTQSGISREFIDQNENALVVNFKDAHAIYNGLKSILGNETLQNRLRENGFKSVQGFSLDTHILALLNLYNRQE